MPQMTRNSRTTLRRTYKEKLLHLLNADGTAMLSSSPDVYHQSHSESKLFERELKQILFDGDFTLEMLEEVLLKETTISSERGNATPHPATGFHKLVAECYKFLTGLCKDCSLLRDDQTQMLSERMVDVHSDLSSCNCYSQDICQKQGHLDNCSTIALDKKSGLTHDSAVCLDEVQAKSDWIGYTELHEAANCLAGLITMTESQSFESLLASVCFRKNRQTTNRSLRLLILESILATNGIQSETDLRNLRLAFGETPLLLAIRARDADVVLTLLRHGADASRSWMGMGNAMEVLLFSPNQVFLEPRDIAIIERCLEHLLGVISSVNMEALVAKEKEGYYPLLPDWRRSLTQAMELAWRTDSVPVPSLQHLCRCAIRQSMTYLGHRLPEGIYSLPLPVIVRQFLLL